MQCNGYPETALVGGSAQVAERLEQREESVLTAWDFYALIRKAYRDRKREVPEPRSLHKVRSSLGKAGVVVPDMDYRSHYRVVDVPDRPVDDIVCLIDRFCHISHLSAMQNWGLTDRQPHELIVTRPDNRAVNEMISGIMSREADEVPWEHRPPSTPHGPFRLSNITHPGRVRGRAVRVRMSRVAGESIRDRNGFSRVATIGQTFLDMVQHPALCGGMAHVLEVWDEYAITYLDHIIAAVSSASSVVKCRAGYIIEERLGVKDPGVEEWHDCAQRGGSSCLDPSRPYIPEWSEKWMISLNA